MLPRHARAGKVAVTLIATLAVCGFAAARPDTRTPLQKTLDSLFYAARYDTMSVFLPALIRAAEARGDSAGLGRLTFQRGRVEITLGHQALASRELDRSIRLCEAARDTVFLDRALNFKGFVLRDQGHFDEAMAMFTRARDLGALAHDFAGEGNGTFNLAYKDLRRGNLDVARGGYMRARDLLVKSGDPYQMAIAANALGNLYSKLGVVDSSRYWFEETLRIARTKHYPFHELWALNNMGLLEGNVGNYETSLECYKSALAIGRRIGFDRGIALPAMNLALGYSYMGRHDLAFESLDLAVAVSKRAGFNDLEVNNTIALGLLCLEDGRNHQAARAFRNVLNKPFVFETLRRSDAAWGLSLALANMDSVESAIATLEPYVSPRAQNLDRMEQPYFELAFVELLRRAHRCDEALRRVGPLRNELDRDGRTDLTVSVRLIESACRREQGDPRNAAGVLAIALDSLEVARTEVGGLADIREAFAIHMMNEVIDGCRVLLQYPPETPRAQRVGTFYDALQRFKTRTLLDRIHDPRGAGLSLASASHAKLITVSHVQRDVLRKGELLLDFNTGALETYCFAVTTDSLRLISLPGWKSDLARQATVYAELLASPDADAHRSYSPERFAATQRTLGRVMLDPVADLIARADRVIVATDGFIAAVPFGTLMLEGNHMLMESKDVVEVPSASVLEWSRQEIASEPVGATSMVALVDGDASNLAGARSEVRSLERRYAHVKRLEASAGVLDTLVRRAQPGRILHLAVHAQVSDNSPWQSGFLLEPASKPGANPDHAPSGEIVLRAWEIARARLPYGAAVLAGCETAAGRTTTGEGVLGLTSAFLSAGVPVVVSSRWAVDDHVTAILMSHFYDGLAAGQSVASALRAAQLAVRDNRATGHPFYWAGFAVVGDGTRVISPLKVANRFDPWHVVYGLVGAFLGILGWRIYRRRFGPAAAA